MASGARGGGLCGHAGPVWPADLVSGTRGGLCGHKTPVFNLGEHRHEEECRMDDHFPLLVFD